MFKLASFSRILISTLTSEIPPWLSLTLLMSLKLLGGLPAAVTERIETHSHIEVSHVHTGFIQTNEDDFNKYKKRVPPALLRQVLRSVALQVGNKFVYAEAARDVHSSVVREVLHLLTLAGLITPVKHTDGTGVPLGAEEKNSYDKYLFFDLGAY